MRRRVPLTELEGEGVADVLAVLADDRLVTIGEGEVEVAHEALLREWPRLRGWLEEDAQGRRLHRQLGAARRASGTPAAATRASSTAARGWPRRSTGRAATRPSSTPPSARSSTTSRAASRALAAPPARRAGGRRARCSCSRWSPGVVALGQRGKAREEATAADAQRLGARALVEDDLDRSLLLARQGVALDDIAADARQPARRAAQGPAAIGVHARRRRAHRGASR